MLNRCKYKQLVYNKFITSDACDITVIDVKFSG